MRVQPDFIRVCTLQTPARKVRKVLRTARFGKNESVRLGGVRPKWQIRTKRFCVFPQARKVGLEDALRPDFIGVCTLRNPARKVRKVSYREDHFASSSAGVNSGTRTPAWS